MCGILAIFGQKSTNKEKFNEDFQKGVGRGPESSVIYHNEENNYILGFHRLAINGLNSESNQPFHINGYTLICNGEIYNYKELYEMMGIQGKTQSDCEVIIYLVEKYGIEQALTMLDGVFAFVLVDNNKKIGYAARDPYGVRPLYYISDRNNNLLGLGSELKMLHNFINSPYKSNYKINQFTPGKYTVFYSANSSYQYKLLSKYHSPAFSYTDLDNVKYTYQEYLNGIRKHLTNAVKKRVLTTERPIACLLSGGLDSSLIASLVSHISKELGNTRPIETYSIGLPGSTDLVYAKQVADYIKSNHTEILVTEQEMLDAIPEVIKAIESYDTTTVRASIGNYLLGKYISKYSQAKVIFNGDGSDELAGGYLYMSSCPDSIEYDKETRRLLQDIHLFDVLRSDKCISSHGLEPRTPFLDKGFVNYYLSIPLKLRNHNINGKMEKYLIREAYKNMYLLPNEVLFRKKEAFSDGVSNQGKSLYQIIQEHVNNMPEYSSRTDLTIKEKEKAYYKDLFLSYYPDCEDILPYYWMPKYILSDDPSARTLATYSNNK
jgi:asparagine synthase (glutamine-hydrolysing)